MRDSILWLVAEDEGFDYIIELPPSSRRQADVHRTSAFHRFESPHLCNKKYGYPYGYPYFLAEDEGFEPPQTESESGVLPLHKSSKLNVIIIRKRRKKSSYFYALFIFYSFCSHGKGFPAKTSLRRYANVASSPASRSIVRMYVSSCTVCGCISSLSRLRCR